MSRGRFGSSTRSGCATPRWTAGRRLQRALPDLFRHHRRRVFRALGSGQYADAKQTGEDFHVVKSVIEYKAPVRFDWELDVARVARIGNSSLTFELAIFGKGGDEALVTGEIVWVNTNQQPIARSRIEGDPGADRYAGEASGVYDIVNVGRITSRECECVFGRHWVDEAIHLSTRGAMDRFAAVVVTSGTRMTPRSLPTPAGTP